MSIFLHGKDRDREKSGSYNVEVKNHFATPLFRRPTFSITLVIVIVISIVYI